ncbi:PAS domain-containing protein [Vreelandella massiliensis]|uniref:PAS domain-containing protein n=1 Tax=Vreelandella massiliensis TaxID=1816686 RepID=UPI0009F89052|nr:PAS domain-containing protein [Halomonas massiliensis]
MSTRVRLIKLPDSNKRVSEKAGTVHILELSSGRFLEVYSQPVMDGAAIGRVWSFHDITDSRRAQTELKEHKERLRRGQMYANIGTWEWHIQSGKLYWTEQIAPLFGYARSEEIAPSYDLFIQAVHPEDREGLNAAIRATIENDAPYEYEHRVIWPDGQVRWLLERGAVLRDAQGAPLQMIGVVQDIDARKRAELALVEREHELLEAQRLAHIGSWQLNLLNRERAWSDEVFRILGYQPGEVTPCDTVLKARIHPEDRGRLSVSMRHTQTQGTHDVIPSYS